MVKAIARAFRWREMLEKRRGAHEALHPGELVVELGAWLRVAVRRVKDAISTPFTAASM
jgi:hypothetical protein